MAIDDVDSTGGHRVERRRMPSEAMHVEFLLTELARAHGTIEDLEALAARAAWRRVS